MASEPAVDREFVSRIPIFAGLPQRIMIDKVKFFAGMTVGSPCLPEPPAPMKRCCARL